MEADGTELLNESLSQDQGRAVVPQKDIIIKALQLLVDKHSVGFREWIPNIKCDRQNVTMNCVYS